MYLSNVLYDFSEEHKEAYAKRGKHQETQGIDVIKHWITLFGGMNH